MITPIFIPIHTSSQEPSKCPQCDKIEDIKKTCRHCSYEYKKTDFDTFEKVYIIGAIISFIALITYLLITKDMCFTERCDFWEVGVMFLASAAGAMLWPITGVVGILFLLSKLM